MTTYDKLRLEWDCRRGMLELDKIIMPFYRQQFDSLSESQKAVFVRLLACTDLQLFTWIFKRAEPEDAQLRQMVEFIRQKQQVVINS